MRNKTDWNVAKLYLDFISFLSSWGSTELRGHGQWRWSFSYRLLVLSVRNCTFPLVSGELRSRSSASWQGGNQWLKAGHTIWGPSLHKGLCMWDKGAHHLGLKCQGQLWSQFQDLQKQNVLFVTPPPTMNQGHHVQLYKSHPAWRVSVSWNPARVLLVKSCTLWLGLAAYQGWWCKAIILTSTKTASGIRHQLCSSSLCSSSNYLVKYKSWPH